MKQTSEDEFPVQRVVKKVYTVKSKKKKEGETSENLILCEKKDTTKVHKKVGPKDETKKITVKQEKKDSPKRNKKKERTVNDDIEDITDKVLEADQKMASSSEEAWSNPQEQLASKALDAALTSLGDSIKMLDGGTIKARRVPQLAETQKFPYVGNSTVKRIITDGIPSPITNDHLTPADDVKLQKLLDFLKLDEYAILNYLLSSYCLFYLFVFIVSFYI